MWSRRTVLGGALAAASVLSCAPCARALASGPVTIIEPIGSGSPMHQAVSLIAPGFGSALGTTARVESIAGYPAATEALLAGPSDGTVVMGRNSLGTAMALAFDPSSPVHGLAPIGKITAGMSAALVVASSSPLATYADFAAAAAGASLRLVHFVSEVPQIARAMLRRELGVDFADLVVPQMADVVETLGAGDGDVGILMTNALLLPAGAGLRPLCTFGGKRHDAFPETPTFRELTSSKDSAFTAAFGLYGAAAIPQERRDELSAALVAAGIEAADAARQRGIKLDIGGQDLLLETMKRDARIATALQPWMVPL